MGGFGAAPVRDAALLLWEKLRSRIIAEVQACNSEAGEMIWEVRDGSPERCGLVVSGRPGDSPQLILSLDSGRGRLLCAFERPAPEVRWEFDVLADGTTLLRQSRPTRLDDAARDILDHLVRDGMPDA